MLNDSWLPPFHKGPLIASQLSFPLLFFTGLIAVGNYFVLFCSHNYSLGLKYPQTTISISAVALLTRVTPRKWLKPRGQNGGTFPNEVDSATKSKTWHRGWVPVHPELPRRGCPRVPWVLLGLFVIITLLREVVFEKTGWPGLSCSWLKLRAEQRPLSPTCKHPPWVCLLFSSSSDQELLRIPISST